MTGVFRSQIRKSLADVNLQSALDANSKKRIQVRQNALASLPDAEEFRKRAHMVRRDVIEQLDSYLDQFIFHAQEHGIQIHQASDAVQAIKIILEIANQHNAKLIAKSKTMVSEEIGLNHELETHHLEVIETDLGEYIVQLRGEPPSHIITPAVHLRRQDVGRLFQEILGVPYTEDISVMTNVARQTLRRVFLNADVGISGVNFGVAETGTLCLVTNEGNGRMVTTLPKIHIALMGIERLVPNMDDLSLMLSLLPRSATGQKLSVYTSIINSPRQSGDPDGPQERHVILVDNGRRQVRDSDLLEILYCIRCGSCLNACPVFREIGGHAYVSNNGKHSPYPGPMGSVVSPALFGQLEYGHLARASSLCGACREACPVDIDLPKLLIRVRTGIQAKQTKGRNKPNAPFYLSSGLRLYTLAAINPTRFVLTQKLFGYFSSAWTRFSKGDPYINLPRMTGWGYSKDFPLSPKGSFRSRLPKSVHAIQGVNSEASPKGNNGMAHLNELEESRIISGTGIEAFAYELTALGGNFISCSSGEMVDKILEILQKREIDLLLVWDAAYLPPGILDRLANSGIELIQPTADTLESCSKVRAGLTGAYAGLADTGSLVIMGGPGKPMLASLLPEIHIAILWEKDIFPNLKQVLNKDDVKQSPCGIVITGPSRTSDIEMSLTIGVHGPGELYVLCIRDQGQ